MRTRGRWSTSALAVLGVFGTFGVLASTNVATRTPPAAATATVTGGTGDCTSIQSCYTPQQLEVAYGVQPLLQRGIDGRGETVVLPELAESQLSPPRVSDLHEDFAAFDRLFHLPAPTLKVVSTFPTPPIPGSPSGRRSSMPR